MDDGEIVQGPGNLPGVTLGHPELRIGFLGSRAHITSPDIADRCGGEISVLKEFFYNPESG